MQSRPLMEGRTLPLLIEPRGDGDAGLEALLPWLGEARAWIEAKQCGHGALLVRGFALQTAEDFRRACHASFGDGSAIDSAELMAVRRVYAECEVLFAWRCGDLLVLDNVLSAHGPKPFKGNREILVAMA